MKIVLAKRKEFNYIDFYQHEMRILSHDMNKELIGVLRIVLAE